MLVSLIAAVVAALFYGVASVMQAIAVRQASHRDTAAGGASPGVDPGLLPRMLHQWRFVASIVIDTLGFVAQLIALQRLPLFAVQAMVAANLAVIAVLAALVLHSTLSLREWLAVTGVVAGVGLLGSSAGAEGASQASLIFKFALLAVTGGLALGGIAAARLPDPARTLLLGTVAGFGYGVLGIAARVLNGFEPLTLLRDPAAYAVVAAGIVSFVFYASALEGGRVTVATAAVVLAETLPPAVIGVAFLGDKTRPGLEPVAIIGFIAAVASAVMLANFGEAEHPEQVPPPESSPTTRSYASDVLSWWPVDLRLYAVTSSTTGAHLGRCSDSVQIRLTKAGRDQASLRYRGGRLEPRQGTHRLQPRPLAEDAGPAGADAEARPLPERRPRHDEPVPAR